MPINFSRLWTQIRLGGDSNLELKEVEFKEESVVAPRNDPLADELAAFGNSQGGQLVLGVSDDRRPQPLNSLQLDKLVSLVREICTNTIKPSLDFSVHRVPVPDSSHDGVLLVEIPVSAVVHRSPGGFLRRQGDARRQMDSTEVYRLTHSRGQSDAGSTDTQVVRDSGINSLREDLWRRFSSSRTNDPAVVALSKLRFAKNDTNGVLRATVGGVLLASEDPSEWLQNAWIQAAHFRGSSLDSSDQLDARDIKGPLDQQIRDAMSFVVKNQRVAAYKDPARTDVPQFSERAAFEAIVNAVVHRDYAISGSRIRLFMFEDRLELYSPGNLCNSMSTNDLRTSQFTRNELLASRLGQCAIGRVSGAGDRQYFIERRGEGIAVIQDETLALTGRYPLFELIGQRELKITLPAARPPAAAGVSTAVKVCDSSTGQPLSNVHVLMIYPNKTWRESYTDALGHARFVLHTRLPMTMLCASDGFNAYVESEYLPVDLREVELLPTYDGGSHIIANRTGQLQGLQGRLNPILDNLDRTYLYADNIAINDGQPQPVHFALNEPIHLTDSSGTRVAICFREMVGASSIFDYQFEN
ncbi:MAG: transcriptional regulator [Gammaproteobacteria bacterium]|nr:transcriptional regulator [Gammaproteobacteria bacterium]MYD80931.1 transcriptional regulator [Gammaproteobacteria bacterium]